MWQWQSHLETAFASTYVEPIAHWLVLMQIIDVNNSSIFSAYVKKRFFYCFYLFIFIYLINFEVECTRREKEMMGRCRGGTWKPVFPPRMWNQLPLLGSDPVYRPQQFNQFFSAYLKKIIFYIICIYLFKNYLIIKYN